MVTDPRLLATGGNPLTAIAADGAARLVVRLYANAAGDQLTVTLSGEGGGGQNGLMQPFGNLQTILPSDRAQSGTQVTVSAVQTNAGVMGFVQYFPPKDFSRGGSDDTAPSRLATLSATESATGANYTKNITILRPPVVLVHGLWSGYTTWDNFDSSLFNPNNQFYTTRSDYSQGAGGLVATVPNEYSEGELAIAPRSALGFNYTAPIVLTDIKAGLDAFRVQNQAAGVQADVVAHSMGGVLTRLAVQLPNFTDNQSFGAGYVHKLVTIGTPHLGSPLAIALLQSSSKCIRLILAQAGNLVLSSATLAGSLLPVNGAVADLEGTPLGLPVSGPLIAIGQGSGRGIPTAVVAGESEPSNLSSLSNTMGAAAVIRGYCSAFHNDPLAASLTLTGWPGNFADLPNDSVVSVRSQLNNPNDDGQGGSGFVSYGILHAGALNSLGFTGSDELHDGLIAQKVVYLLNYPLQAAGSSPFSPLQ